MSRPYQRRTWRGVTLNNRTIAMLEWAEKASGVPISVSQGSYAPASPWSGTTHTGGGTVDVRTTPLTDRQRKRLVRHLKQAGFAAWYRGPGSGFSPHIHAVAIRDKQLASSAAWQVQEFLAGRNGLTSGGADRTWRADPQVRWSWRKGHPVAL